jgi:hypothetical protein
MLTRFARPAGRAGRWEAIDLGFVVRGNGDEPMILVLQFIASNEWCRGSSHIVHEAPERVLHGNDLNRLLPQVYTTGEVNPSINP